MKFTEELDVTSMECSDFLKGNKTRDVWRKPGSGTETGQCFRPG
jgi:hypothetical protein